MMFPKFTSRSGSRTTRTTPTFYTDRTTGSMRVSYGAGSGSSNSFTSSIADSGMVTGYRPAEHQKPQYKGFMAGVQRTLSNFIGLPEADKTTAQGSQAAEPSIYRFELYDLRYTRRAIITETRQMYYDDPRIRQSVDQYVEEAVRDGFWIIINNKVSTPGVANTLPANVLTKAKECKEDIERCMRAQLGGCAKMLMVEGDLFAQPEIDPETKRIVGVMRMPAAGMERITDDTDKFIDPDKAYAQVGVMTNMNIAYFPQWSILHLRYDHVPGDKYGNSRLVAVRRQYRKVVLMEESQCRRRMIRAAQHTLFNIGTPEKPGDEDAVQSFKTMNGFVEGNLDQWDPTEVGRNFFGNGTTSATVIEGDTTIHNIEDIEYAQDVLMSGLPTPAALLPVAARLINRDVLKDQRSQWLLSTKKMSNMLANELIAPLFELALMLQGIDPADVDYSVHFSESAVDTRMDIINGVKTLRGNTLGSGPNAIPDPLITKLKAVELLAEVINVADPELFYEQLMAEGKTDKANYGDFMDMRTPEPHAPTPSLPGNRNPSPGKSRNPSKKAVSDAIDAVVAKLFTDSDMEGIPEHIDTTNLPWAGYGNVAAKWWYEYGSTNGSDDETSDVEEASAEGAELRSS